VLTGYNCDLPGELGMLAFTLGQGHGRGIRALLAVAISRDVRESWMRRRRPWSPLIRYLLTAYLRGRRARPLAPVCLEHSLALPIDSVRQRLAVEPCERSLGADSLPPISVRPPRELGLVLH
jgi:ubiquinone biosynthesis protein Coq4